MKGERQIGVAVESGELEGVLCVPDGAEGLVIFAHGSGSGRHSLRNRMVSGVLQRAGLGTLLADLLTPEEAAVDRFTREYRFDVGLLAARLAAVTQWALRSRCTRALKIGYFGASTGAAAALMAAAERPDVVRAVVSRGGRPDLAGDALSEVRAPTLFIVGGEDVQVKELNEMALGQLATLEKRLEVIPRATHLFEEPGALEQVADLSRAWLKFHLTAIEEPTRRAVG